ncbi:hypothetical protein MTR67_001923 [Solanum verrucosum]|uniref:Uncharacterized protein n=1 Tax=Solanum verrucosum TaxID=315347 RepID=A0AAF0PPG0_SOLVR|nr:hypothetical protein MTR67_001923 [Solanum verrucosum]
MLKQKMIFTLIYGISSDHLGGLGFIRFALDCSFLSVLAAIGYRAVNYSFYREVVSCGDTGMDVQIWEFQSEVDQHVILYHLLVFLVLAMQSGYCSSFDKMGLLVSSMESLVITWVVWGLSDLDLTVPYFLFLQPLVIGK